MSDSAIVVYSQEQKQLMLETVAKNCPTEQFLLMMELAKKYKLDPFARQIWATKAGIIIGRDGFLTLAHNSGDFDGMETQFEEQNGKLISATTTVWHKRMSHPITFTARFEEFNKPKSDAWRDMPYVMLQKCSESNALRRAFCVTGLYDAAEMEDCPHDYDYEATVDGEPVEVEILKPETLKAEDTRCVGCGGKPMVDEERYLYENSFRSQGLGEVPKYICKDCVNKLFRERKEEKQKEA